jgi:cell shape-determining protein MreC
MQQDGKPMIENSDRGITMAKPLAWSILCGIVAVVYFGGSTVTSLSQSTQAVTASLSAMQAASVQVEGRVRALENNASRQDARFEALKQSLDEVKEQGRETNTLLRQLMQGKSR